MPELPEVEVTRLGLLPFVTGRRITRITWSRRRLRTPLPRKLLQEHILAGAIVTIDRRAKYLLFRMNNRSTLVIHLGMTGKLGLLPSHQPYAAHDHLRLKLDNSKEIRFNDVRRFGSVMVWPPGEAELLEKAFSAQLGVEPFADDFNIPYLRQRSRTKKQPVKNFLMDSRIVAGIGNIYANEILFAAGIHPQTPVTLLTTGEWKKIVASTHRILEKAIQEGGSTISDFLGSSGNPGYFQFHFNVYKRAGELCKHCRHRIEKMALAGRATYFCPHCQHMKQKIE